MNEAAVETIDPDDESLTVAVLQDEDERFIGVLMDRQVHRIAGNHPVKGVYIDWDLVHVAIEHGSPDVQAIGYIIAAAALAGFRDEAFNPPEGPPQ